MEVARSKRKRLFSLEDIFSYSPDQLVQVYKNLLSPSLEEEGNPEEEEQGNLQEEQGRPHGIPTFPPLLREGILRALAESDQLDFEATEAIASDRFESAIRKSSLLEEFFTFLGPFRIGEHLIQAEAAKVLAKKHSIDEVFDADERTLLSLAKLIQVFPYRLIGDLRKGILAAWNSQNALDLETARLVRTVGFDAEISIATSANELRNRLIPRDWIIDTFRRLSQLAASQVGKARLAKLFAAAAEECESYIGSWEPSKFGANTSRVLSSHAVRKVLAEVLEKGVASELETAATSQQAVSVPQPKDTGKRESLFRVFRERAQQSLQAARLASSLPFIRRQRILEWVRKGYNTVSLLETHATAKRDLVTMEEDLLIQNRNGIRQVVSGQEFRLWSELLSSEAIFGCPPEPFSTMEQDQQDSFSLSGSTSQPVRWALVGPLRLSIIDSDRKIRIVFLEAEETSEKQITIPQLIQSLQRCGVTFLSERIFSSTTRMDQEGEREVQTFLCRLSAGHSSRLVEIQRIPFSSPPETFALVAFAQTVTPSVFAFCIAQARENNFLLTEEGIFALSDQEDAGRPPERVRCIRSEDELMKLIGVEAKDVAQRVFADVYSGFSNTLDLSSPDENFFGEKIPFFASRRRESFPPLTEQILKSFFTENLSRRGYSFLFLTPDLQLPWEAERIIREVHQLANSEKHEKTRNLNSLAQKVQESIRKEEEVSTQGGRNYPKDLSQYSSILDDVAFAMENFLDAWITQEQEEKMHKKEEETLDTEEEENAFSLFLLTAKARQRALLPQFISSTQSKWLSRESAKKDSTTALLVADTIEYVKAFDQLGKEKIVPFFSKEISQDKKISKKQHPILPLSSRNFLPSVDYGEVIDVLRLAERYRARGEDLPPYVSSMTRTARALAKVRVATPVPRLFPRQKKKRATEEVTEEEENLVPIAKMTVWAAEGTEKITAKGVGEERFLFSLELEARFMGINQESFMATLLSMLERFHSSSVSVSSSDSLLFPEDHRLNFAIQQGDPLTSGHAKGRKAPSSLINKVRLRDEILDAFAVRITSSIEKAYPSPFDRNTSPTLLRRIQRWTIAIPSAEGEGGGETKFEASIVRTYRWADGRKGFRFVADPDFSPSIQGREWSFERVSYELEVETSSAASLITWNRVVRDVYLTLHGSKRIYTLATLTAAIEDCNAAMGAETPARKSIEAAYPGLTVLPQFQGLSVLSSQVVARPRDLQRRDLTSSGIGGTTGPIRTPYMLALKANGFTRFLAFLPSGVWLMWPPYQANWIVRASAENARTLEKYEGCVILGESIPKENRKMYRDLEEIFVPFDILSLPTTLQTSSPEWIHAIERYDSFDYVRRIAAFTTILRTAQSEGLFEGTITTRDRRETFPSLLIVFKRFFPCGITPEQLGKAVRNALAEKDEVPFETDGMIVTPILAPQNPHDQQTQGKGRGNADFPLRVLSNYPDVCKIKPWRELTIDFGVSVSRRRGSSATGKEGALSSATGKEGTGKEGTLSLLVTASQRLIPFTGTFAQPFRVSENVDSSKEGIDRIQGLFPLGFSLETGGYVVEFGPTLQEKGSSAEDDILRNRILMEPRRVRLDKKPNNRITAENVWQTILNPLSTETLLGSQNFDLLFQQNNVLKTEIFRKLILSQGEEEIESGKKREEIESGKKREEIEGGKKKEKVYVVDLGSGKGGDVSKLRSLVVGALFVEPETMVNSPELKRRVLQSHFPNPTILETVAEDTSAIVAALEKALETLRPDRVVVSMMLSLSFFWESSEKLAGLERTLLAIGATVDASPHVHDKTVDFAFFTIEGRATEELFVKRGPKVVLGPVDMSFTPPNQVQIDIAQSIVRNQTEYLVDLDDLSSVLIFGEPSTYPSLIETYLSQDEKTYGSLFVWGIATIRRTRKEARKAKRKSEAEEEEKTRKVKKEKDNVGFRNAEKDNVGLRNAEKDNIGFRNAQRMLSLPSSLSTAERPCSVSTIDEIERMVIFPKPSFEEDDGGERIQRFRKEERIPGKEERIPPLKPSRPAKTGKISKSEQQQMPKEDVIEPIEKVVASERKKKFRKILVREDEEEETMEKRKEERKGEIEEKERKGEIEEEERKEEREEERRCDIIGTATPAFVTFCETEILAACDPHGALFGNDFPLQVAEVFGSDHELIEASIAMVSRAISTFSPSAMAAADAGEGRIYQTIHLDDLKRSSGDCVLIRFTSSNAYMGSFATLITAFLRSISFSFNVTRDAREQYRMASFLREAMADALKNKEDFLLRNRDGMTIGEKLQKRILQADPSIQFEWVDLWKVIDVLMTTDASAGTPSIHLPLPSSVKVAEDFSAKKEKAEKEKYLRKLNTIKAVNALGSLGEDVFRAIASEFFLFPSVVVDSETLEAEIFSIPSGLASSANRPFLERFNEDFPVLAFWRIKPFIYESVGIMNPSSFECTTILTVADVKRIWGISIWG